MWIHRQALRKLNARIKKLENEWETPLLDSIHNWDPTSDPSFPELPPTDVSDLSIGVFDWFQRKGCPLPKDSKFLLTPSNASLWLKIIVGLIERVQHLIQSEKVCEKDLEIVVNNLLSLHQLLAHEATIHLFTKTALGKCFIPKKRTSLRMS